MPHGTPDWGLVGPKATTYGLDDLGEHAVRLRSPHLWDRRGDVLWLTDFRNGMGDVAGFCAGAGRAVALYTGFARQGAYCVLLQAGSDGTHQAWLYKTFPLAVASNVGAEFSFSIQSWTQDWEVQLHWWNGARYWDTAILYDEVNDELNYMDAGGLWVEIADDFNLAQQAGPSHVLKLVVDINLEQYVRVILNDQSFSLAGIGARDNGVSTVRSMDVFIYHRSVLTHVEAGYVDNIIVTQNEP